MRRIIQRWISGALLSASTVAAAVSVSYGQTPDVAALANHESSSRQGQ